jgi:hypothetical protein
MPPIGDCYALTDFGRFRFCGATSLKLAFLSRASFKNGSTAL